MAFDPIETLRAAGILGGPLRSESEQYYRSLNEQETSLLISLKDRLPGFLPEVQGQSWSSPEAMQMDPNVEMACACGAWSGSGSSQN
jgi:hypothetical protein